MLGIDLLLVKLAIAYLLGAFTALLVVFIMQSTPVRHGENDEQF